MATRALELAGDPHEPGCVFIDVSRPLVSVVPVRRVRDWMFGFLEARL